MTSTRIKVATPDGTMTVSIARPSTGRPRANILMFMDAMGIRDELVELAQRIADQGYDCYLPDLYYRWGEHKGFDATKSYTELPTDEQAEFYSFVARMKNHAMVLRDVDALLKQLSSSAADGGMPWGAIGFCMGGRFVLRTMAAFPDLFRAGVSAYGTNLVTGEPTSPHRDIGRIKGEFYLAFGDEDELTPSPMIEGVRRELQARGTAHEIEIHRGCGHAFMMPGKASSYRHEAAEKVWAHAFALFARTLGPAG